MSKFKMVAELVSSKAFLFGQLDGHPPIVSSHGLFSIGACILISSSYKDKSHIGIGPILTTSFYLNYFFRVTEG